MSELAQRDTEPQATAGGILRAARRTQGIQLETLAAQLKISVRKLEALEADRLDELQGPTFVRALAQAACRILKVDPAPVLARLPRYESSTLGQVSGGLNAPFRERAGHPLLGPWVADNRWAVIGGGALVLGAIILLMAPPGFGVATLRAVAVAEVGGERAASAAMTAEPTSASVPTSLPDAAAGPMASELLASAAAASAPALSSYQVPRSPAAQPAPVLSSASAGLMSPLPDSSSVTLQIAAQQASWVEIRDSRGKLVFGRQLQAGEVTGLAGVFPMRVKIGNAAGTTLTVRGQIVDLGPVTRDNVARLELN